MGPSSSKVDALAGRRLSPWYFLPSRPPCGSIAEARFVDRAPNALDRSLLVDRRKGFARSECARAYTNPMMKPRNRVGDSENHLAIISKLSAARSSAGRTGATSFDATDGRCDDRRGGEGPLSSPVREPFPGPSPVGCGRSGPRGIDARIAVKFQLDRGGVSSARQENGRTSKTTCPGYT